MTRVEHPSNSLLHEYVRAGAYTDCYRCSVDGQVALSQFLCAFYSTWVFRLERKILDLASRPFTDDELIALAEGKRSSFAAWTVEHRVDSQLLLCDDTGRTRSWFMIAPKPGIGIGTTTLYFGSAVVPNSRRGSGQRSLGPGMRSLLVFHKLYSRILLRAAAARLAEPRSET